MDDFVFKELIDQETEARLFHYVKFWMMYQIYMDERFLYDRKRHEIEEHFSNYPNINNILEAIETRVGNSKEFNVFLKGRGVETKIFTATVEI